MGNPKSFFFITLLLGMLVCTCKKENTPIPTDEEILGSIQLPQISDEYNYPIQPGMPEWATLKSHDEMLDAIQIPDSVLKKITTWGLLQSCFKYPLYGDFAAFNDQVGYMNELTRTFSGFKELFSREDAPKTVLYFYRHWDVTQYPDFIKRNFIEISIGSDAFLSKLNKKQLLYLISIALDIKEKENKYYKGSLPPFSYFVMANSMIHYPYQPFLDYCSTNQNPLPDGYFLWRINSSIEKIEAYSRRLLNL